MDRPKFVYEIYIATTPERLWEALTGGEFTYQYWGGRRIQSDWKPGSPVRHVKEDGSVDWQGEVLRADPPRLLSYTFEVRPDSAKREVAGRLVDDATEPPSRVTFELSPFMDKVKLTLTHDDFTPGSKVLEGVSQGWPAILSSLKSLLERGEALFPEWR
jgi:uncharacterized protein YndB with AHSA1/START domain